VWTARGVVFIPRGARIKSLIGIYHIMMRGINRQILFEEKKMALNLFKPGKNTERFVNINYMDIV